MNRLAIIGAGGHGRVVADCARLMEKWDEIVFYDDRFGGARSVEALFEQNDRDDRNGRGAAPSAFVAIGNNAVRQKLLGRLIASGFDAPVIRHPAAIVAHDAQIGAGSVLVAGAILNPGAKIGAGCIINTAASVDHDCSLGECVHVAPGARLAGTVSVGERSWIGLGAVVCENRTVGADVMVAAGAVVIRDAADGQTVRGVPAI